MGYSDRDMQRGTILVFRIDSSEPQGVSLLRDQEIREPITLLNSNLDLLPKEPLQTHLQIKDIQHQLDGENLSLANVFDQFFVYNFCCKFFKCEELQFTYLFLRYLVEKNVKESDRDMREMILGEKSYLRLRSLVQDLVI